MFDFDKSMFAVTATAPQGAGDPAAAAAPPPEVKVFEDPPPEVGFSLTKFRAYPGSEFVVANTLAKL